MNTPNKDWESVAWIQAQCKVGYKTGIKIKDIIAQAIEQAKQETTSKPTLVINQGEEEEFIPFNEGATMKNDWRERFDEYYPELLTEAGEVRENVKEFIAQVEQETLDRAVEAIPQKAAKTISDDELGYALGFNEARILTIEAIQALKNKDE